MATKQQITKIQSGLNSARTTALNIQSELAKNASAPSDTSSTVPGTGSDKFLAALQKKLMDMSPIQSSANTQIEDKITQAISGLKQSQTDTHTATNLAYGRQEAAVTLAGQNKLTQAEEAQRGYAVNTGLIKNITNTTNTEMKDLELRKQEALAYGDAQMAGQIANLQLKGLAFQQQAQQQVFTNLLSMGGLIMKVQQENRIGQAQTFQEHQAISNIALRYGIKVLPNDTIESVTQRAMPFADKAQKLELQKTQAQISEINAQTTRALRADSTGVQMTSTEAGAIADAYLQAGPVVLGLIKNPNNLSTVLNMAAKKRQEQYEMTARQNFSAGITKADSLATIHANKTLTPQETQQALNATETIYGNRKVPTNNTGAGLPGFINSVGLGALNTEVGVGSWLLGTQPEYYHLK